MAPPIFAFFTGMGIIIQIINEIKNDDNYNVFGDGVFSSNDK